VPIKLSRVRVKRKVIRDLLQSDELDAVVLAKAQAVADLVVSKGVRVEGVPGRIRLPIVAKLASSGGRSRAHVILDHPSGLAVESKHKLLATNIDAARDVP
jgi:hypothetical protein